MSIANLLTTPCTLLVRSDSGSDDGYGNSVSTVTEVETVCAIQQRSRDEEESQGELSDTSWLGVFPAGTDLTTADAVDVEGYGRFELVGDPWTVADHLVAGTPHHVEATLRRTGAA